MAQNIDHKKSTLDDDASIYQKKEERDDAKSVKQKWSEMTRQEKVSYFKYYYMKPLIIAIIALIFIGYVVYDTAQKSTSPKYYMAVLSEYYMNNDAMENHLSKLEDYWKFEKRESAEYTTNLSLGNSSSQSTFVTYLYAGTLNVVIGTEEQLETYGYHFYDFDALLPEDVYNQVPEEAWCELTYQTMEPDKENRTTKSSICGIYVDYTIFADNYNANLPENSDKLIMVFPIAGSAEDNAADYNVDFFKYALGMELK